MVSLNQEPYSIMRLKIMLSNIHNTISLYNKEHLFRFISLLEDIFLGRGQECAQFRKYRAHEKVTVGTLCHL